jgi:MFS family permease
MVGFSHYMLMTVLPGYAAHLGSGSQSAGLIMGIYSFSALAARPLSGYFMDTIGRRAVMTTGGVLFLLGTLALNRADRTWFLIAIRVVQGIGFSAVSSSIGVVLADLSPPRCLSEGLGWLQVSNSLTLAVGPFSSLAIVASSGFTLLFPVVAAIAGVGTLLTSLIIYPGNKSQSGKEAAWMNVPGEFADEGLSGTVQIEPGFTTRLRSRISSGMFSIAAVNIFMTLGLGTVFSFVTLHGNNLGLRETSLFFPLYALASITTVRMLSGPAVRRFGPVKLMTAGLATAICGYIALGLAGNASLYLFAALLMGAGFGLSFTMGSTLLMSGTTPEKRGMSNAINFDAIDIGSGSGSMLGGILAVRMGYGGLYLAASATGVAALTTLFLRTRRQSP